VAVLLVVLLVQAQAGLAGIHRLLVRQLQRILLVLERTHLKPMAVVLDLDIETQG
jgi:hypothetical protein